MPYFSQKLSNFFTSVGTTIYAGATEVIKTIFYTPIYLFYTTIYSFNYLVFTIVAAFQENDNSAKALCIFPLVFFISVPAVTFATLLTTCLFLVAVASIIFLVVNAAATHLNKYYKIFKSVIYIQDRRHNKNLHELSLSATFFILCMLSLPIIAYISFVLAIAIINLGTMNTIYALLLVAWDIVFTIKLIKLIDIEHKAPKGESSDAMLYLVMACSYIACITIFILLKYCCTVGLIYEEIFSSSMSIIALSTYGIICFGQDILHNNNSNKKPSKIATNLKYNVVLQLETFARTVSIVAISILAFKVCGPALMALIAPYATYMLVAAGAIALIKTTFSHDNMLGPTIMAIMAVIYAAATCYMITQCSVAFIIAPQLLSIILAIGVGVIGSEVLFYITTCIINQGIDKVFKSGSTVKSIYVEYQAFISSHEITAETVIGATEVPTIRSQNKDMPC